MIYQKIHRNRCGNCNTTTLVQATLYVTGNSFQVKHKCTVCGHDLLTAWNDLLRLLDFTHMQLSRFIADEEEWSLVASNHLEENPWIQQYMDAQGWRWICVCGGKVVGGSADPQDFPSEKEKLKLSEDNGGTIPFCYAQPIVSE